MWIRTRSTRVNRSGWFHREAKLQPTKRAAELRTHRALDAPVAGWHFGDMAVTTLSHMHHLATYDPPQRVERLRKLRARRATRLPKPTARKMKSKPAHSRYDGGSPAGMSKLLYQSATIAAVAAHHTPTTHRTRQVVFVLCDLSNMRPAALTPITPAIRCHGVLWSCVKPIGVADTRILRDFTGPARIHF